MSRVEIDDFETGLTCITRIACAQISNKLEHNENKAKKVEKRVVYQLILGVDTLLNNVHFKLLIKERY